MNTKEKRLSGREKKKRWKEEKRARRAQQREFYRYAPWHTRFWNLYAKKPLTVLLVIALIAGMLAPYAPAVLVKVLQTGVGGFVNSIKNDPVDQKEIYARCPIDEEGAKRIDALPAGGANETWTICVYMVGSNLEDFDENDLSQTTKLQIRETAEQIQEESYKKTLGQIRTFNEDLGKKGLEMPYYYYYPNKPTASSKIVKEEVVVADQPGCASEDIGEMTSDTWADNIRIVLQTGGAKRWSNQNVNPNRTQRFLYEGGDFTEIENLPLQPSYEPDTLADFMDYCRTNYPADHQMLILWDHGGGAFGYGKDSITGGMMSIADIRTALSSVYQPNPDKPAFDVIGFDACLMSSLEVTHALNGFARYYAVSEETEPGEGWNYGPWLKALTDDPSMNPARLARHIADSFVDYYVTQNINIGFLITNDVTFSVLDAKKCEELYGAYCDLAKAQLTRAAGDISVLADIGRCADRSTHLCSMYYNIYNTVDLGNYVDYMVDTFPDESSRVKQLIGEAVLYHRQCGSLSESQGISVYIPSSVETLDGMNFFLNYVNDIAEDNNIRALYYYKVGGCLNEELEKYTADLAKVVPKTLNTKVFRDFAKLEPKTGEDGFSIPVSEELAGMIQKYELEVSSYDKEEKTAVNYGKDVLLSLDGEGNLKAEFDGRWMTLDGVPLAVEVASSTPTSVEYRSKVLYDGDPSYLVFDYDLEKEEFSIDAIRKIPDPDEDGINYLVDTRDRQELETGSRIIPLYTVQDFESNESREEEGDSIKIKKSTRISLEPLPDGYYLSSAVISDQRGESYYSAVVGNKISGGRVKERKIDKKFSGRAY